MTLPIFFNTNGMPQSSQSVTRLKMSKLTFVSCGRCLYRYFPVFRMIEKRFRYYSGNLTQWNPKVRSNTANTLASDGILLKSWPDGQI